MLQRAGGARGAGQPSVAAGQSPGQEGDGACEMQQFGNLLLLLGLPRRAAATPALRTLPHWAPSAAACCLQDLSVIDGDWQRLPEELLRLPLTRLHLRYADFADAEGELRLHVQCGLMWPCYARVCACGFACCAAAGGRCVHYTICQLPNCRRASVCMRCVCVCVPVQGAGCPRMLARWRAPFETSRYPDARSRAPKEGQYQASSQTSGSAATCCHLTA